jgi:hypothetical protein
MEAAKSRTVNLARQCLKIFNCQRHVTVTVLTIMCPVGRTLPSIHNDDGALLDRHEGADMLC